MVNYREDIEVTKEQKEKYLSGIDAVISRRQQQLSQKRAAYSKDIFTNAEKYRRDFINMLGWPLTDNYKKEPPKARSEQLASENGYRIFRMHFEIIEGLEMSGLYFESSAKGKRPLVLVQHGGDGTPERVSGFYDGDTTNYHKMLEHVIAQGTHAFAPQLLLWNKGKYGVSYDRVNIDARLKRVGGSITSLELYGLTRILDYFEEKENVSSFGMVGMSYGGFYTLFLSAIDKRIKAAVSSSFFNSRDQYPWSDWTWFDSAAMFDDAEVAALVYPRHLCIALGERDELFNIESGKKSFERLSEMCGVKALPLNL